MVKDGKARKLSQPWRVPFKVIRKISAESMELAALEEEQRLESVHVNRLKKCPEGSLDIYPLSKEEEKHSWRRTLRLSVESQVTVESRTG